MMKKRWSSIFLFCWITLCCTAQTAGYKFYSQLDSIKTSGFYNIEITPALSVHLKTDYSDLRIVNDSGKWVPHVLHFPANEKTNEAILYNLKFTIKENNKINTTLLIEPAKEKINNIGLVIRNTAAKRYCTISGSDDAVNWFVINDSVMIDPSPDANNTKNIFTLNFPSGNYKFFKLVIHNNNKDPFDIKGAVNLSVAMAPAINKFILNPATTFLQKDSDKISYIKITQQLPYHFSNISIKLSGSKYFYRNVDLYIPYSANHSFSNPGQLLQSFVISNNSTLQFNVPINNAAVFYILIHNEDNLPLIINDIKTFNNFRFITSDLQKGNRYKLIMENSSAVLPNYDLNKLNTTIPDSIPFLTFRKIITAEKNNFVAPPAKNNKWILWAAIAAALLILLLFTKKMITEVDKRNQDDSV